MISSGFANGNLYSLYNPSLYPVQKFDINAGSIYSALISDNSFSIYKNIIDKSQLYKNLFNDSIPKTFFVVPDKYIPDKIKNILSKFSRDEATCFLDSHTIDAYIEVFDSLGVQTRQRGVLISRNGNTLQSSQRVQRGQSSQSSQKNESINLLTTGTTFFNGVIYVIDKPILSNYSI